MNEREWQCTENVLVRREQIGPLPRRRCLNALENNCFLESERRILIGFNFSTFFFCGMKAVGVFLDMKVTEKHYKATYIFWAQT